MSQRGRVIKRTLITLAIMLIALPVLGLQFGRDWRTADRSSTGIAPDPATTREAVVQVYAARAFNWRGLFAVHTWIAIKPRDAANYTIYQVLGWNKYYGRPLVSVSENSPDRLWYGNPPWLLVDIRGARAESLIPAIARAVASYPYPNEYGLWPGPNSNTFTAFVGRRVPALGLDLPPTAIGKDYPTNGAILDSPPSGSGVQASLWGILGVIISPREGLEVNILSLDFGIDIDPIGLRLPLFGNLHLPGNDG